MVCSQFSALNWIESTDYIRKYCGVNRSIDYGKEKFIQKHPLPLTWSNWQYKDNTKLNETWSRCFLGSYDCCNRIDERAFLFSASISHGRRLQIFGTVTATIFNKRFACGLKPVITCIYIQQQGLFLSFKILIDDHSFRHCNCLHSQWETLSAYCTVGELIFHYFILLFFTNLERNIKEHYILPTALYHFKRMTRNS